ncbi:DUF4115 domain-containing protein [Insolitispirillum peregrinum]|uniref:DUF4115 domain-containing protein n=1 Tax=Insolitispirillum peregrinum TaxID=80876 RepID=UPI0036139B3C
MRAYAEHLGLDGLEIVRRFKDEENHIPSQSDLSFPVPAAEGGIPSSALLAIALLLAGLIYGAWYWTSSADRPLAELIQDVPERLNGMVKGSSTSGDSIPHTASTTDAQGMRTAEIAKTPEPAVLASLPSTPDGKTPEHKVPESQPVPKAEPVAQAPATEPAHTPTTTPEIAKTEPAPAPVPAAPAMTASPPTTPPTVPQPAPPAPAPATPATETPVSTSRVELYAQADAWIQIRKGNDLVVSRLFRRGETYPIPDGSNMILRTGNAGGTVVRLDGETLPPLGKSGEVVSGVSLNPDNLVMRSR